MPRFRLTIRRLMIVVALAAELLAVTVWLFPRKHHRCVLVYVQKFDCGSGKSYHFDTDIPRERAAFEAMVQEKTSSGYYLEILEY